jgi:hypothetical protein
MDLRESIGEDLPCDTCTIPTLWQSNLDAWNMYGLISNKFTYDFHAISLVFEIYKPSLTRHQAMDLFEKLVLIHSIITKREDKDG